MVQLGHTGTRFSTMFSGHLVVTTIVQPSRAWVFCDRPVAARGHQFGSCTTREKTTLCWLGYGRRPKHALLCCRGCGKQLGGRARPSKACAYLANSALGTKSRRPRRSHPLSPDPDQAISMAVICSSESLTPPPRGTTSTFRSVPANAASRTAVTRVSSSKVLLRV